MSNAQKYKLDMKGVLVAHNSWVTAMKVGEEEIEQGKFQEFLITGSRDNSLIVWDLHDQVSETDERKEVGTARKILTGHSHFISDLDLSQDSRFCLSSSWDGTIRLWNLKTYTTRKTLVGHTKDVLSVAFSADNRQIMSGSMDKNVKIWNIHGACKYTVDQNSHTDWVSCVRYFWDTKQPICVSASWDRQIKVWDNTQMQLMHTFVGHTAQINCLDLAPNTKFLGSGGKDGIVHIWNIVEGRHLEEIDAESPVNCILFASKIFWLVIGTQNGIKVFDLPNKKFIDSITAQPLDKKMYSSKRRDQSVGSIACLSLCWSKNQNVLYSGWSDNVVRAYDIVQNQES